MTLETIHIAAYTGGKAPGFTPELPAMEGLTAAFSVPRQSQTPWVTIGESEAGPDARAQRLHCHGSGLDRMQCNRKKPAQDLRISVREEKS